MSLNELGERAYKIAVDRGWHDTPTTIFERLLLIHSEVSEATESLRKMGSGQGYVEVDGKPEGFASELADIIIRTVELAHPLCIDLDTIVAHKMAYNEIRSDWDTDRPKI